MGAGERTMTKQLQFSEEEIQSIFGHEAAEDERPERLKEYYFKGGVYDKINTDLSLRILVGHKGIGKSALFAIAIHEDEEAGRLPILIRPDDILGIGKGTTDFLETIREWKKGLQEIIAKKALGRLGVDKTADFSKSLAKTGKLVRFITDTLGPYIKESVDLGPAQKTVVSNFLKNQFIVVYIDDLDRGWQGRKEDIAKISALLNALRDLTNDNKGLRFRLALRSDVYHLVRTSDESTDKVEGSVVWFSWTNHEILAILVKRIETFFGRSVDEDKLLLMRQSKLAKFLDPVMEPTFTGSGKWANAPTYHILMSLIRKRPRDLVKLCTLAARSAHDAKRGRIATNDFKAIFEEYSQGRVQDTINEFRSELPDLERLVVNMKPNKKEKQTKTGYVYRTDQLLQKISNIKNSGAFLWFNRKEADTKGLANFLYKINFLTARKVLPDGHIDRKYFEENRYLSSKFSDFGYDWEIHPAYRWALQPDTIADIFEELDLSA